MVQDMLVLPDVDIARCDQCMFGQWTYDDSGNKVFARKRMGFMSNCLEILEALTRTCDGKHQNPQLINGRAKDCAAYPARLVKAVLRD